jgi:predicted phage baseplate assembly protein
MAISELPLTNVTADTIKQELVDRIKVFFPDWTDQQDSNNMIMLLEQMSALAEMEYTYINKMAREAFIQYALDPRNVAAHARGLGYTPRYQSPSVVQAHIVSSTPLVAATVIPAGTKFGTVIAGVMYETTEDVTMQAGTTVSDLVTLKQQESWYDDFSGTGDPTQQVNLNHTGVMPDTIQVVVNGVSWDYVDNFIDSNSNSTVFTYLVNTDGTTTVIFGNGVTGKKVPASAAGRVYYKTGGGKSGAIGPKQLSSAVSEVRDTGNGALLSLTAVNDVAATHGADVENIDQIRKHAVANLRAPRVLLTTQDIEDAVSSLAGVQVCKAVNWELVPSLPHYLVEVFVVPVGGGQPTQSLIDQVMSFITVTKPLVMGHKPLVIGPTYKTMDFKIQVFAKNGYSQVSVNNAVKQFLLNLFDPSTEPVWGFSPEFGMGVYSSQISAMLQQVEGVRNLAILSPGDTELAMNEFPVVGNVTFV